MKKQPAPEGTGRGDCDWSEQPIHNTTAESPSTGPERLSVTVERAVADLAQMREIPGQLDLFKPGELPQQRKHF